MRNNKYKLDKEKIIVFLIPNLKEIIENYLY